ncbi:mitochondrial fission process protein 1-like isoform X2 [Portunus trituberculatus]|uniref:mitochondrial fission process protein 1-like isoform X2 n=1 Tax=Portunus trituberculatus TaxID=210409 RepID=UPI001E1CF47D|nr:mitochondrial fission process protein 1-like isoform X2 [Portunus trituberculatus]
MTSNRNCDDAMMEEKEVDIYRDTPVRLLGYANEVGESFRALTPLWFVRSTYGVASAYVVADTYDKATKMSKQPGSTQRAVTHAAVDTLLWQALASVIVPGFTINRVCAASLVVLAKALPAVPLNTRKWVTTALGLGCIPFIVHPIDTGVHWAMDRSVRKYLDLSEQPQK